MLTSDERRIAMALGIALRIRKEAGVGDWISKTTNAGKTTLDLIGGAAKWSTVAGLGLGVPAGAIWFALDRARKNRTRKEREKEQEIAYYRDYLQSVGAE